MSGAGRSPRDNEDRNSQPDRQHEQRFPEGGIAVAQIVQHRIHRHPSARADRKAPRDGSTPVSRWCARFSRRAADLTGTPE